jgi:predicted GNAT superfamily acetyltransferase
MSPVRFTDYFRLVVLERAVDMIAVEELQRTIWPGCETDVVPGHMLLASAHHGGLVIGAYQIADLPDNDKPDFLDPAYFTGGELPSSAKLVGFAFGFPGTYETPDGPRLMHYSHMLGVHPSVRSMGIGFALKRAQWQMTRHLGIDRMCWTYDPLLSPNAYLNISRLGAVCSTYIEDAYGIMQDGLNAGLPSDRFQVDWWLTTARVNRRLSRRARQPLSLAHFLSANAQIINPAWFDESGLPHPVQTIVVHELIDPNPSQPITLVEIPADFLNLKSRDLKLALSWRMHARALFQNLFQNGYLVTDFVHLAGEFPRSYYVLSFGESTL